MLIIKSGDLLEATENIICHQCNTLGIFGGGIAYQIKQKYPQCEKQTTEFINSTQRFGDYYLYVNKVDKKMIANCFTQSEDYITNYEWVCECFTKLKENCIDMKQSIAIPYNYGCGIANGEWSKIEEILIDIFTDIDLVIYKYDGDE